MQESILKILKENGKVLHINEGQHIFSEGDPCKNFIIVTRGQIKVFKNSEKGREFVLYRVSPDHICVLTTSCLLSNSPYSANAKTETDIEAISLEKSIFDKMIVESHDFREMVFSSLSKRFNGFVEKIDEVVFHTLKNRLIEFLKNHKNKDGKILMTHQDLASELGTDREVISRLLNQLKKENKLTLQKGEISISK